MNTKRIIGTVFAIIGIVAVLSCAAFARVRQREQCSVIEALRTTEREHGWRVLLSERGVFYLDLGSSSVRPLYLGNKSAPRTAFIGMASLNPAGNKIVFSESSDLRSYSLTIVDLVQHTHEQLLQIPYLLGPRWSKDGNLIAFEGTTEVSTGPSNLYLYNPHERELSLLVSEDLKGGDFLFCWAPNGRAIVYQSGDDKIKVVDIESKQTKTIDSGQFPTWSPNGLYISYQSSGSDYSLYNIETRQKKFLLKGGSLRGGVVWSPDSRYIVYARASGALRGLLSDMLGGVDSYGDLYAMDLQSNVSVRLHSHDGSIYPTDWSPIQIGM